MEDNSRTTHPIELGPFQLHAPIATGGMGTVWRGVHEKSDTPVAVKVVSSEAASDPIYREGFAREVRAVARLDHPRIVNIYDHGRVPDTAAETSDGELQMGSPWFAMELATHGSLAQLPRLSEWSHLQAMLFDILDALAHSHARGIIHRDLKPGNVLLVEEAESIRCKLSDFGIAHARGQASNTREVFASAAGTPWYMAPEQIESYWRDYGPWTDLYALGCLAYELASGRTPFVGKSAVKVARQQLFDRPPEFEPRFSVPEGFSAWLNRLLSKEIAYRFQRAADAAWALRQLSPDTGKHLRLKPGAGSRMAPASGEDATLPMRSPVPEATIPDPPPGFAKHSGLNTLPFVDREDFETKQVPAIGTGGPMTFSIPPIADDWRRPYRRTSVMAGAGLGLFGLRELPFVGRSDERDTIWKAMRQVAMNRERRAVIVRGGPGLGKSRLCEWMAQRAHETGAATILDVRHSGLGSAIDGLARMLERHLNCTGLDLERTYERVKYRLAADAMESPDVVTYEASALTAIMRPGESSPRVPTVQFSSPRERHEVLGRFVVRVARDRPALVWIDDAQWGHDTLEFVRHMLGTREGTKSSPVLFLISVEDEAIDERPLEHGSLEQLVALDTVVTESLEPLPIHHRERLLDGVLGLSDDLRDAILDNSPGSPLFTIQLLEHWVEQDLLVAGDDGYELTVPGDIPETLTELFSRRIDHLLGQTEDPENFRKALEIGAAMGLEVDEHEWRRSCAALDVEIPSHFLERVSATGAVERDGASWSFAKDWLRSILLERARNEGRADAIFETLAEQMLASGSTSDDLARAAGYFIRARRHESAIAPLEKATRRYRDEARLLEARHVCDRIQDAIDAAGLPPNDERRATFLLERIRIAYQSGDHARLTEFCSEAMTAARDHRWLELEAVALRTMSWREAKQGNLNSAENLASQALTVARRASMPDLIGGALRTLSHIAIEQQDIDAAEGHLRRAIEAYEDADNDQGRASCFLGLADVERSRENYDQALEHIRAAEGVFQELGSRVGMAKAFHRIAIVSYSAGRLEDAEAACRRAIDLYDLAGHYLAANARTCMGQIYLRTDRPVDAENTFEEVLENTPTDGRPALVARMGLSLAVAAAFQELPGAWDERMRTVEMGDVVDRSPSLARLVTEAGDIWRAAGHPERARQAYEVATSLCVDDEIHAMVAEKLNQIDSGN